jgi:transcriptional regulator with XRE-family HTH domain
MKQLTLAEIETAYRLWYLKSELYKPEQSLAPFLDEKARAFELNREGWLKKIRTLLQLSGDAVARKMDMSRAAYAKFEEGEALGTISLASLDKAARAMDYELVYAIRPKNRKFHSEGLWRVLLQTTMNHPLLQSCDPRRKPQALVSLITKLMADGEFRKIQGWSQRSHPRLQKK